MTIGITSLAVTTWFATSSSLAYGDAPWCAVINLGKHVYWDCQYRTFEACYPYVIGGPLARTVSGNPSQTPETPLAILTSAREARRIRRISPSCRNFCAKTLQS